jgi:Transglycosylase-like domain
VVTRRQPHDRWHDAWTLVLAVGTVLLIWAVWEMTEPQTPAPVEPPQSTVEPDSRADNAVRATSRDDGRTPLQGAPVPDTSGTGLGTGKEPPRVAGHPWGALAECESGGDWQINTGNGYYGGLQFSLTSWRGVGGTGYPHEATRAEQIARAEKLLAVQGWGAWPTCSQIVGLP